MITPRDRLGCVLRSSIWAALYICNHCAKWEWTNVSRYLYITGERSNLSVRLMLGANKCVSVLCPNSGSLLTFISFDARTSVCTDPIANFLAIQMKFPLILVPSMGTRPSHAVLCFVGERCLLDSITNWMSVYLHFRTDLLSVVYIGAELHRRFNVDIWREHVNHTSEKSIIYIAVSNTNPLNADSCPMPVVLAYENWLSLFFTLGSTQTFYFGIIFNMLVILY